MKRQSMIMCVALSLLILLFQGSLFAQIVVYSDQIERWGMQEVVLHSARSYSNQFTDVQLQGRFPDTEFKLGDGVFRVDLIDPWAMKVTTLGYTQGPTQKIRARITPGIYRIVKVDQAEPGAQIRNVSDLGGGNRRC